MYSWINKINENESIIYDWIVKNIFTKRIFVYTQQYLDLDSFDITLPNSIP